MNKSSEGFKKAKATLSPAFASNVNAYDVLVPIGTTHLNIMATSFSRASVKIDGHPGNMAVVAVKDGAAVSVTLHDGADGDGVVATYVLTAKASGDASGAVTILHEKPPVAADDAAPHTHMHGGVACTADHSKDGDAHGHSHDGGKTTCTKDHGHSHDGGKTEVRSPSHWSSYDRIGEVDADP
jgi:hypothetical protein